MLTDERFEASKPFMVGMADLMVSQDQDLTLCTFPLGACLGIAIYDPATKVGGLLHSMLPDSSIDPKRAAARPALFLDTGVARLLECAADFNVSSKDLRVYVAGGSDILDETACFNIGRRNYEVLQGLLTQRGLRITAEDVGGLCNRTMQLSLATGEVRLKYSGQANLKLLCKP